MLRSFSYSFVTMMGCILLWLGFQLLISGGRGDKIQRVDADFNAITAAIESYRTSIGGYPTTDKGFGALVERPSDLPASTEWKKSLVRIPADPWQNEYRYRRLPHDDPRSFEIRSLGKDGVPSDDDLSSLDE